MKEGGGGGGGRGSCRLGSREGNGERKWVSIKLCQGQFAVNGPLHLVALSLRGCWLLGPSMHCMLGGAHPLKRQPWRQKYHHYTPYYSSSIIMQIPGREGDAMLGAMCVFLYTSTSQAFLPLPEVRSTFLLKSQ